MIEGLRYKLCMVILTIDGPSDVFCDNQSVITNIETQLYLLSQGLRIAYVR